MSLAAGYNGKNRRPFSGRKNGFISIAYSENFSAIRIDSNGELGPDVTVAICNSKFEEPFVEKFLAFLQQFKVFNQK